MPDIIIAVLLLVLFGGGWLLLRPDSKAAGRAARYAVVAALVLLGVFLAISGRAFFDLPLGAAILWLTRTWFVRGLPGLTRLMAWLGGKAYQGGPSDGHYSAREQAGRHGEKRAYSRDDHSAMTEEEALQVLGLDPGANENAIRAAHRNLIIKLHPDHGGSSYLARQINTARDVLLKS